MPGTFILWYALAHPPTELVLQDDAQTIIARFADGGIQVCSREGAVTQTTATQRGSEQANAIRPFPVANVPEAELTDLRKRINATKLPERETVADASQGVQLATIQALARYWATDYDWRKCEARLQSLPNFLTEINGLDIHFIHVRSKHENALPLIVTHGWPGSITEQLKIIDPPTNPTAHGGNASDAFYIVVPSMPGYGFSGEPATTGWDPAHIARAWTVLMKGLGYNKIRGARRRLGCSHHRADGRAGATGVAGHSYQHG
jgi:Epoxide hydrolase N terminus